MSANDAMLDAIEYISFFYPLGCSVGEVQKYLNAKKWNSLQKQLKKTEPPGFLLLLIKFVRNF